MNLNKKRKNLGKNNILDKTQKKKKKEKITDEALMEEIKSDDESISEGFEGQDKQKENEKQVKIDFESADQKRLRLAKQILESTKQKTKNKNKDDFFVELENDEDEYGENKKQDDDDYVAVYRDEDIINQALQEKILKKKQQIYNLYSQKILEKYEENEKKIDLITLKGHTKCITCLEIDPSQKFLYSASKDSSLIKWDLEKQKKIILSLGKDKEKQGHYDEILTMALNFEGKLLLTAGKDRMIKLWDVQQEKLIETFKGHKDTIQAVKFGINSNVFCTTSCDRTFKMWDAQERAYMETFYGHKSYVNSMDAIGQENFITSGFDKQIILWKTGLQSQLIFEGHDYSIDQIKGVTLENFLSGSQDGSVSLWSSKKKKPLFTLSQAHGQNKWITALGNQFNTDVFASGSYDNNINLYQIQLEKRKFNQMFKIPTQGIINDIQISQNCQLMAFCESDEHKLGRWITQKAKNQIKFCRLY